MWPRVRTICTKGTSLGYWISSSSSHVVPLHYWICEMSSTHQASNNSIIHCLQLTGKAQGRKIRRLSLVSHLALGLCRSPRSSSYRLYHSHKLMLYECLLRCHGLSHLEVFWDCLLKRQYSLNLTCKLKFSIYNWCTLLLFMYFCLKTELSSIPLPLFE